MRQKSLYIPFLITLALVFFSPLTIHAQKKGKKGKGKGKGEINQIVGKPTPSAAIRLRVDKIFVEACTQMIRGDLKAATDHFEEVLTYDPVNHAAMYNIAKLAHEERDYPRALNYSKAALDIDPGNYWYYHLLQQTYEKQGNYERAIEVLEKLVQQFPSNLDDQLHLATLYERASKFKEALDHLNALEERFGPKEQASRRKYQLYKQQGELEKALEETKTLVRLNPTNSRYYQWQYESYQALNKPEEGIEALKTLLERDSNNGFALLTLADYYKSTGDLATSDQYLFQAFANEDIDAEGKIDIVKQLLTYVDKEPEVIPRITELSKILVKTHPNHAGTHSMHAEVFLLNAQADSASFYFRKSLAEEPNQISLWERMLEGSFRLGNYAQLQKDAEESLEFFPNQLSFLFYFGVANSRLEDYRAANYALEKIQKIGTDQQLTQQVKAELAYIAQRQDKVSDANQIFEQLYQEAPENTFILHTYAQSLIDQGQKLDLAQKMMNKAIESQPNFAGYQATYGWILFLRGKTEEAESWLQKSANRLKNPQVFERFGDVLQKLGKKEAATKQWQKAIDAGAKHIDLQQKQQN